MTVKELVERKTDRVRLPDWIEIPEGSMPRIGKIHVESWTNGCQRGEAYVYWRIVAPYWRSGCYENVVRGQWFDIKDLELVEEGESVG